MNKVEIDCKIPNSKLQPPHAHPGSYSHIYSHTHAGMHSSMHIHHKHVQKKKIKVPVEKMFLQFFTVVFP